MRIQPTRPRSASLLTWDATTDAGHRPKVISPRRRSCAAMATCWPRLAMRTPSTYPEGCVKASIFPGWCNEGEGSQRKVDDSSSISLRTCIRLALATESKDPSLRRRPTILYDVPCGVSLGNQAPRGNMCGWRGQEVSARHCTTMRERTC